MVLRIGIVVVFAPLLVAQSSIFEKTIAPDQLAFLGSTAGTQAKVLVRDKQFHKLLPSVLPDCEFHYGRDMPLSDAMDMVMRGSVAPVRIRDGRYVVVSGLSGPYLAGRGFLWFDLKDGVALGGFYFRPTNGEPSPAVNIFSRQVREKELKMSQLPAAFVDDFYDWAAASSVPPVTTRYFLTAAKKKILLEHDEDYCTGPGAPPTDVCQQMNADAADLDMEAASYLDLTNHATNATAHMINGPDQVAWLQIRVTTCGVGPDPIGCRIRMARARTRVIMARHPVR